MELGIQFWVQFFTPKKLIGKIWEIKKNSRVNLTQKKEIKGKIGVIKINK
jgi:hypothetical protein